MREVSASDDAADYADKIRKQDRERRNQRGKERGIPNAEDNRFTADNS